MKTTFFLLASLLLAGLPSFAQENPNEFDSDEYFILLFDNTLLEEGDFTRKKGLFSGGLFYPNGDRINYGDIKFFQDERGYFGNSVGKTLFGQTASQFTRRYERGPIDLFFRSEYDYNPSSGTSTRRTTRYYSFGVEGVKRLHHKSLKQDLLAHFDEELEKDNLRIMALVEKGRKRTNTGRIALGTGLGVFLVGAIIWNQERMNQSDGGIGTGMVISGVGFVTAVSGLFINGEKFQIEAIREYNDVYDDY